MARIEQIAEAAVDRNALLLRSLVQDLLREEADLAQVPPPQSASPLHLAVSASLLELLASRAHQSAPHWTATVAPLDEDFFLVASAETMNNLRRLCLAESPEPLRRRRLYAPPDFLTFA